MYSPFLLPTRAAPTGPLNGAPEMVSAAEAPIRAETSGLTAGFSDLTVAMICTSLEKPSMNRGRIGREAGISLLQGKRLPAGGTVIYTPRTLSTSGISMALNIRNAETERLAERVVSLTGETKTAAVTQALRERLERLERAPVRRRLADELDAIAHHAASLPLLDPRSADEILGYDTNGLPR